MRIYPDVGTALSEIRRDLSKAPSITSTRVQNWTGLQKPGREIIGYQYMIDEGGIPEDPFEMVDIMANRGFGYWAKWPEEIGNWMKAELKLRTGETQLLSKIVDHKHPALKGTYEGSWPAYTYRERMDHMVPVLAQTLLANRDTRRAYWPMFRPEDALRAQAPTRIPCSIGWEFLIRNTPAGERLQTVYLQRSADFDIFFGSDIWLSYMVGRHLADWVGIPAGQFIHNVISLHSFTIEGSEIY